MNKPENVNDVIDIDLEKMKNIYPINETFKSKQKTTSGKVIPFEEIDLDLYKPNANCACFITSNSRIHAWITAIAEVIYIKEGKGNKNVVWTDKTDSNNKIVQTEFVISDSNTLESKVVDSDDFLYKVIIYLTTGKILTQGKLWESFCKHQFEKCKLLVNALLNSDTCVSHKTEQFDMKSPTSIAGHTGSVTSEAQSRDLTEETTPKCFNNDIDNSNLQTQDQLFVNTTNSITSADVQKQFDIPNKAVKVNSQRLEKEPEKIHESEKMNEQTLTVIQNRIDIIEESLVKVSKSLSNLLTLQSDSKTNILSELQNMSKSIKCNHIPPDTKIGQVDMVSCAETIIIHVGINNLKNESAEEAFCKYTDLIEKALEKSELVVISLVLPSQIERLNVKIREFNEIILYKYDTADKIKVCRNSNFISNGNVVKKFYWDSFRLNKFEGVRVLAGNIRNTLFPRTRNQVPHSQKNLYVNSYRESQKDTISSRNDYKYPYNTPNRKNSNRSDQGRNSETPAGNTYQGPPNTYYERKLADSIATAVASVFRQYHEFGS